MQQTIKTLGAACAVYGIMAACSGESPRTAGVAAGGTGQGGAVGTGGQVATGGVGGASAGSAGSPVPDASAAGAGGAGCDCPGVRWELAATVGCDEGTEAQPLALWEHQMADDLEVVARVRVIYDAEAPLTASKYLASSAPYTIRNGQVEVACRSGSNDRIRVVVLR